MKHFLLSEQDTQKIYWVIENMVLTILEKLEEREVKGEEEEEQNNL
jgi:hypothetical protein